MNEVYLQSLVWDKSDPAFHYWHAQEGMRMLIDVRSNPQCGDPGTQFPVRSFCQVIESGVTPSGILIGENVQGFVTKRRRQSLGIELGLGKDALVADRVDNLVIEIMTRFYDATGQTMWKPIRGSQGRFTVHLGEYHRRETFNTSHPAWAGTLDVFQVDYRSIREFDLARGSSHYRKVLGAAAIEYSVPWQQLVEGMGEVIQSEEPDKPSTDLGDTFVEAGDTTLASHTATGPNSGFGWTRTGGATTAEVEASTDTLKGAVSADNERYRADSDLSSDDMSAKFDVVTEDDTTNNLGPTVRHNSSADSMYTVLHRQTASNTYRLFKWTTGTPSQIGSTVNATPPSATYELDLQVDGSSLTAFVDSVSKVSGTDSSFTGQVRAGLLIAGDKWRIDNWVAMDLAAGGQLMGGIAGPGGLAGPGGIAGRHGGIAG